MVRVHSGAIERFCGGVADIRRRLRVPVAAAAYGIGPLRHIAARIGDDEGCVDVPAGRCRGKLMLLELRNVASAACSQPNAVLR